MPPPPSPPPPSPPLLPSPPPPPPSAPDRYLQPATYIELKVAAVALKGRRLDPFAVLARSPTPSSPAIVEISRTETVWNDTSPAFVHAFRIACIPPDHPPQHDFRMLVYAATSRSDDLRKNSLLGYADFSLDRALAKPDGVIERVLRSRSGKPDAKRGSVVICVEKVTAPTVQHTFSVQLGFSPLSQVWGPDSRRKARQVFYVIYRAILNGVYDDDWTPVYRSEILDPYFTPNRECSFDGASIAAETLYGMDENRGLRFEVFHYNPSGPHIPLGFVQTSASAFKYAKPGGKLYMVPVPGSRMKAAHVTLKMAKMGLTTRRGGVSSVFCLSADGFTWGLPGEGLIGDDYLERDAYGRTRVEFLSEYDRAAMPRGVSYMGSRIRNMGDSDGDDDDDDDDDDDNAHY